MIDYSQGKIYIVKCKIDDSLKYIGSTTMILEDRFSRHKYNKTCSLYKYI